MERQDVGRLQPEDRRLNGVSSSVELDTENSDDKAGSPATKTKRSSCKA